MQEDLTTKAQEGVAPISLAFAADAVCAAAAEAGVEADASERDDDVAALRSECVVRLRFHVA